MYVCIRRTHESIEGLLRCFLATDMHGLMCKNTGEYLENACGEDVVAGIRTPTDLKGLKKENPKLYKELMDISDLLEQHLGDMQDIEFTVESGR